MDLLVTVTARPRDPNETLRIINGVSMSFFFLISRYNSLNRDEKPEYDWELSLTSIDFFRTLVITSSQVSCDPKIKFPRDN